MRPADDNPAPKLYRDCGKCNGTGDWVPPPQANTIFGARRCPDCDALGIIPTDAGERVLELVTKLRSKGRL